MIVIGREHYKRIINKDFRGPETTDHSGKNHCQRFPYLPLSPDEDWVRCTLCRTPGANSQVMHRTYHVIVAHKICTPNDAKYNCAPEGADKPFNRFIRRKLYQRCTTGGFAPDVSKHVVADHQ